MDDASAATGSPRASGAVPLVAFVIGAVLSLLLGVLGAEHDPDFEDAVTLGFGSVSAMKVYLAWVVAVLAIGQVMGALWLYGKLPIPIPAPTWLGRAHRTTGVLALVLSIPVAYNCLWGLGFQAGESVPLRAAVHSIAGCAIYGAVAMKVAAVRTRAAPGWFLPVAGGLLFTLLIVVVWTGAGWYVGEFGWPSVSGDSG